MMTRRCNQQNRNGKPCGAPAGESGLCAIHANPERARELGAKGGKRNRQIVLDAETVPLEAPTNAREVKVALGRIMADVHNGKLDSKKASVAVYAGMAFIKALETSDLELRIKVMEEKVSDAKKQS